MADQSASSHRIGRLLQAGGLAGTVVWTALGLLVSASSLFEVPTGAAPPSPLHAIVRMLTFIAFGLLYAVPVGLFAAVLCLPLSLWMLRWISRVGKPRALTLIFGATFSALATAVALWFAIIVYSIVQGRPLPTSEWVYAALTFAALGGPIGGYMYWRLMRRDERRREA